jgi:hypothetical protein
MLDDLAGLRSRFPSSVKHPGAVVIDGALWCASRTGLVHPAAPVEEAGAISTVLLLSLDHLGDVIQATPAVEALKTVRPEVRREQWLVGAPATADARQGEGM